MARWLVYAMVFMQAAFLVFSEDAETGTEAATHGAITTTPTVSVVPTRASAPPSTKPPIVHNENPMLNVTESIKNITVTTRNPDPEIPKMNETNPKGKSGASSPTTYYKIVMGSIVGVILFSAI